MPCTVRSESVHHIGPGGISSRTQRRPGPPGDRKGTSSHLGRPGQRGDDVMIYILYLMGVFYGIISNGEMGMFYGTIWYCLLGTLPLAYIRPMIYKTRQCELSYQAILSKLS